MKVSTLIDYVRIELKDEKSTRFSDDKILSFLRRAFIRAAHLIRRNGIELGKRIEEIEVTPGRMAYDLPFDFMSPIALFNGTNQLVHNTIEQFNAIEVSDPCSNFIISGDEIWILGLPQDTRTLRFYYYFNLLPEEITLTSETPFGGKLDMMILEYLTLRAKNVKENEISVDMEFLKDFEAAILETFKTIDPIVSTSRGWTS